MTDRAASEVALVRPWSIQRRRCLADDGHIEGGRRVARRLRRNRDSDSQSFRTSRRGPSLSHRCDGSHPRFRRTASRLVGLRYDRWPGDGIVDSRRNRLDAGSTVPASPGRERRSRDVRGIGTGEATIDEVRLQLWEPEPPPVIPFRPLAERNVGQTPETDAVPSTRR